MSDESLVCPDCARSYPDSERFCAACGMPLVYAPGIESPASGERERKARKIKPQYTEGELVQVASAENLAQAEFVAGLLLEEGIPCLVRSSIGGYGSLTGPRDLLVPESGAEAAREALAWDASP